MLSCFLIECIVIMIIIWLKEYYVIIIELLCGIYDRDVGEFKNIK